MTNSHTTNSKLTLFLASTLILFALTSCDNSKDKEECSETLVGLATCLPYVGGTAKSPTPDCCSGLKQLLKTNKTCLCVLIKDRNDPDLGLNINITLALGLPALCNAPANVSECPALLKLPPNSPEAQDFYQLGKNSSNSSASSPVAGGPTANVHPNPTSGPARASQSSTSEQNNGGCGGVKRWLGLFLLWALIM